MRREEQASDPSSPMAEITETFEMHLCPVTATIARFWGLKINQDTRDFDALEALLKNRYGYWTMTSSTGATSFTFRRANHADRELPTSISATRRRPAGQAPATASAGGGIASGSSATT